MADVVKYGIQIPNRIFVGGIAFDTKEDELKNFFQQHGKVKDCKIVADKDGFSRGFGFVTFESKQEAIQTQKLGTVFFREKKLNLGPAIRQKGVVFSGAQEASNEPVTSAGVYLHPSGYCYTVAPNGVWYFHSGSSNGEEGQPPSQQQTPVPVTSISQPPTSTATVPLNQHANSIQRPQPSHTFHPPAPQPAVPITIIPAEPQNVPANFPVNGHYVIPQNYSVINTNGVPETQRHILQSESNFVPCYVSQPQPIPQMNTFPITSPPPMAPPQMHPMPPSVHVIRAPFPATPVHSLQRPSRPEVYQVLTSPYDSSIIEHGPFINANAAYPPPNVMKPPLIRPNGPMKRISAEYPPPTHQFIRNYEVLTHNGYAIPPSNGSSTPSSLSTSVESDPDHRDESK